MGGGGREGMGLKQPVRFDSVARSTRWKRSLVSNLLG